MSPPVPLMSFSHDTGIIGIAQPSYSDLLYYGSLAEDAGVGSDNQTWEAAIRLTPNETADYVGYNIEAVKFNHWEKIVLHAGNIKIYAEGNSTHPGPLLTSEPFRVANDPGWLRQWFEIPLSDPITIPLNQDLWISVEFIDALGTYPISVDEGPAVPGKSDWIKENETWYELLDEGISRNWNIVAKIKSHPENIWEPKKYDIEGMVKNFGNSTETQFTINATIWSMSNGESQELIYYWRTIVASLAPGQIKPVIFGRVTFNYQDQGDYKLIIATELSGDENTTNDSSIIYFTIYAEDTTPPDTTHEFQGTLGENDWYTSDVTVTLTAIDFSGINYTMVQIDDNDWDLYEAPFSIAEEGRHLIAYYSEDNKGNIEDVTDVDLKIDKTPPTISITKRVISTDEIEFTAHLNDENSGHNRVEFYLDHELLYIDMVYPFKWTWTGQTGEQLIVIGYDNAGLSATDSTPLIKNYYRSNRYGFQFFFGVRV